MTSEISQVLSLAHHCPTPAAFEHELLNALERTIGFDAAFFATTMGRPTAFGLDANELQAVISSGDTSELAPLKQAAKVAHGVVVDTAVLGEATVRSLSYHRQLAAPVAGRHSLLGFLQLRGRMLGTVMLGRRGTSFSTAEVGRVQRLLPSIACARASFCLPWVGPALPAAPPGTWLSRAMDWVRSDRVLESVGDDATRVVVRERRGFREMAYCGEGGEFVWTRAKTDEPSRSGWFYIELFHLAAARARARDRVLFIGCGGAVAVRQFAEVYPMVALDVVESDPRVVDLARRWFGLDQVPNVRVLLDDGAALLARAGDCQWDVIVVDAYGDAELPNAFACRAFYANVRRTLCPGGCVAVNVVGTLGGEGPVQAVEHAVSSELQDVRLVPVLDPGEAFSPLALRNVVVLGSRE